MARYVVGDPVTLTVTFTVDGTATDPTTVTLEVTDPSGNTDTYTYGAAEITKTSTGVFTKTVTVDERGTWTFLWTGTGTAADLQDGTFEVYPVAATERLDILTFGEAKGALNMDPNGSDANDPRIRQWITAVSRRVDDLCGPVVQRTITGELHNGGSHRIFLDHGPASSVTTLTEYVSTTATTLTVETNASKPSDGFLLETVGGLSWIWRRNSGTTGRFPSGIRNVEVDYVAGRYEDTASVDPKFKMAVAGILRRLWARDAGAWARGSDPFEQTATPAFFDAFKQPMAEFLTDERRPPAVG